MGRKNVRFGIRRPFFENYVQHLRNHVARTLDHDGVADADINTVADFFAIAADAANVIFIVQRRVGDNHSADGDGLQPCERVEGARAAHIDLDGFQNCRRAAAPETCAPVPSAATARRTEPRLKAKIVDLIDDAIDVVTEIGAIGFDRVVMLQEFRNARAQRVSGLVAKPDLRNARPSRIASLPASSLISPQP